MLRFKPQISGLLLMTLSLAACNESQATKQVSSAPKADEVNLPPTISLIGEAETTLERGQAYLELFATAIDPEEGDLSARISISGSVNFNEVGDYELHYAVTDSKGLTASAKRMIHVRDTTDPVVSVSFPTNASLMQRLERIEGSCETGIDVIIWAGAISATRFLLGSTPCVEGRFILSGFNLSYPYGVWSIIVSQTDSSENNASQEIQFTTDVEAPFIFAAMTSPREVNTYGDGRVAVNSRQLIFRVTCEAGASIEVRNNGIPSIEPIADSVCPATNVVNILVTLTDSDGDKNISFSSRDAVGNLSYQNINLTLDRMAPTIEVVNANRERFGWRGPVNFNEITDYYTQNFLYFTASEAVIFTFQSNLFPTPVITDRSTTYQIPSPMTCSPLPCTFFHPSLGMLPIYRSDLRSGDYDGPGYIQVTVSDRAGNQTSRILPFVFDFTGPTMSLIGEAEVTTSDFWNYFNNEDPGATAIDDELGDISSSILRSVITPQIPNPMVHYIYYSAHDGWGNFSDIRRQVSTIP